MNEKKQKRYIRFVEQIMKCLRGLRVRKYSSKFSKRTYNNWVHIVLLALKQRIDRSYRDFCDIIDVCTEILDTLGIAKAPHFSTLQKAAKRLRISFIEKIMAGFVMFIIRVNVRTGIDATGLQPTRASSHYIKVIKKDKSGRRKVKNYIKLTAFADLDDQVIISQKIRRAPAHDIRDFKPAITKGKQIMRKLKKKIISVDGDKGYDSEESHRYVVEDLKAEDRIRIKNKDVPIWKTRGQYRKAAKRRINRLRRNHRSKNETIFSVVKRIEGSTIRSKKVSMQNREILFKEIAYNANRLIGSFFEFLKEFYTALYS